MNVLYEWRRFAVVLCFSLGGEVVAAQQRPVADTARADSSHAGMDMGDMTGMPGMVASPMGIPVDRMGSGTTWITDAATLPSLQKMVRGWDLMTHGLVFLQYNRQGGPRGGTQAGSLNWAMVMASHALAGGRFQLRSMVSLDPLTVGGAGYPLLLQTGESHEGVPLRDRQHPHDFWMELGVLYERVLTRDVAGFVYAAPSGEPALGPVAFMHRPSAADNPLAPLSHHWADATHITFGVLTTGLFGRNWKLEGSVFNGREPNDERWGFDKLRLDSYAGRLTVSPGSNWSMTLGYGFLRSPEAAEPDESVKRAAASILYGRNSSGRGQLGAAVIWGGNWHSGRLGQSLLFEGDAILNRQYSLIWRTEWVQKTGEDLVLPPASGLRADDRFDIGTISSGLVRELGQMGGLTLGVGAMGTLNVVPAGLSGVYGSRFPVGGVLFLRVRPHHQGLRRITASAK